MDLFAVDRERTAALTSMKWTRYGPKVLPAWVADMDFLHAPAIQDVIIDMTRRGDFGYNYPLIDRARHAWVQWMEASHGAHYDFDEVLPFCDVLHAIETVLYLHLQPGDGVLLLTPIYPPFIAAATGLDRRMVGAPLQGENWRIDYDTIIAALDPSTRAILLCNPHNPTGRVFDREELATLVRIAEERDLLIISDEIWSDLLHPGATHVPMVALGDEARARTVTISAASKTFNLAGLRFAVAHIGHAELRRKLQKLPSHLLGGINSLGAAAAIAGWQESAPWLDALRLHLTDQRDHLAQRLATELADVEFRLPEATYLAWLNFSAYERAGPDPAKYFLANADVAVSSGLDFGPLGVGCCRLNLATSREILDELFDRIAASLS